jgi:hypothetical protein
MIHPLLQSRLEPLAQRQRSLKLWSRLAVCWFVATLFGLGALGLQRSAGWTSPLALPCVALAGIIAAFIVWSRSHREVPDWRSLARSIEVSNQDLDGRLITAIQFDSETNAKLDYLQQRVLDEALVQNDRSNWAELVPQTRLLAVQAFHLGALLLFAAVLWGLWVPPGRGLLVARHEAGLTVTPGDVSLERGSSLVVMARFDFSIPVRAELVIEPASGRSQRLPMVRSLADPLFGATVLEVGTNLAYHLEYAGHRTRDYRVTVFDYPRLERSDADVRFPDYTGQPARHIDNTRRLSAVEGSQISLTLHLNKAVAQATLLSKGTNSSSIPLAIDTGRPLATLTNYSLTASGNYNLQLVDAEGRTNKVPAEFALNALKNRAPEIKITSPAGDTRPSALQELSFNGTVWDDFGVNSYGLAYSVPGQEPQIVELGHGVSAREKREFHYLLRLEDLGMHPDDLLSWFIWADDIGPGAQPRRTTSDLFFAEIRPFDQIFREGQSMANDRSQQQQDQSGGGESPAARLTEMQKQIISATWNVYRQEGRVKTSSKPGKAEPPVSPKATSPVPRSTAVPIRHSQSPGFVDRPPFALADSSPSRHAVMGQVAEDGPSQNRRARPSRRKPDDGAGQPALAAADNVGVLQEAQTQALELIKSLRARQTDPRTAALWDAAANQMELALAKLQAAAQNPAAFQDALAAEQAAYRALLKLREKEFAVTRNRNNQRNQGGRQQQMQRELEQLDLTRDEDRYETEQQARVPQSPERRDQLQIMNRLQELARRQQDLNERLNELQTALQEARTEQEREEIRRQLKRLQEQEQELIASADEIRQIMDRPENQSRMTDQRRQLDQARNDLQRAAEATQQGQPSQALASGNRAQQQVQNLRNEMRRESAGEFDQELRQMRADARELARRQEEIQKQIDALNDRRRRTLTDTSLNEQTLQDLAAQRQRLTNLVQNATQLSQQAEEAEPLMSRALYDTLRKFSQNDVSTVKEFQEELMKRGMLSRDLYERLKRTGEESNAKSLDLTGEMLRQGYLGEAGLAEQRARADIDHLKRGVERAAESVLGDDAESMRQARADLDNLARQLEREIAQAQSASTNASGQATNSVAQAASTPVNQSGDRQGQSDQAAGSTQDSGQPGRSEANAPGQDNRPVASAQAASPGANQQPQSNSRPDGAADNQSAAPGSERGTRRQASLSDQPQRRGVRGNNQTGDGGGGGAALDRLFDAGPRQWSGPITGEDFGPWSDGLREVEELLDAPGFRNDVARARERARQMRQEYRREGKKPDWANVRLQVLKPLVEVSRQITEELARRGPREDLVPIDRDPVPGRYSELVRRYYEELGKGTTQREAPVTNPRN